MILRPIPTCIKMREHVNKSPACRQHVTAKKLRDYSVSIRNWQQPAMNKDRQQAGIYQWRRLRVINQEKLPTD